MKRNSRHDAQDKAAAASYIASFASELAEVARTQGLASLAYLLEMARLEAEAEMRRGAD